MTIVFQLGGLLILLLLCTQLGILILTTFRRLTWQQKQFELSSEILKNQLLTAQQQRLAHEQTIHSWQGNRKFQVSKKVQEGGGICSFYLSPHDKKSIPTFKPGQYLTFELSIPGQDKKVIRCYSISDSPQTDHFRISVKKILPPKDDKAAKPGLVSSYLHEEVQEGDILDVKAPAGHFFLDTSKRTPVVLIGGGVGITPVLSMLNAIIASGTKREVWFFLGVRNKEEHVFQKHLQQIAQTQDHIRLHVCYSAPGSNDRKGEDYTHAERVTVELLKKVLPSNNFEYFICGPSAMMNSIVTDLKKWGVPEKGIHFEAFGAASVKKVAPASTAAAAHAAKVSFSKSNKQAQWEKEGMSLLELAESSGVTMAFGCRSGSCGTCLTAIKEGEVDYFKEPGCSVETGTCLPCICKPKNQNLVLDA
jgi:uncharacterized protein